LTWRILDPQPSPAYYRAPSWSWAAIDGKVLFSRRLMPTQRDSLKTLATVQAASTAFIDDPYGEITGGQIELEGLVAFCETTEPNQNSRLIKLSINGIGFSSSVVFPDHLPANLTGILYVMPISEGITKDNMGQDQLLLCGILLKRCDERQFLRVAFTWIWGRDEIQSFKSAIRHAVDQNKPDVKESTRVDSDGNQLQTITII